MACGMQILAAAGGETKRVIEEAECGVCCQLGNAEKLAEAVITLKNAGKTEKKEMQDNALKYCNNKFEKNSLLDELDRTFE